MARSRGRRSGPPLPLDYLGREASDRRVETRPRNKLIRYEGASQDALAQGVARLASAARATLGPTGRYVGVERTYGQAPLVTRDSWQVARTLAPADPFIDSGVRVLKDAMYTLNERHGDGSATLAVIADATIREARRHLAAGVSAVRLRQGLERALVLALATLEGQARPLGYGGLLAHVAGGAARDPQVGALIAEALETVGDRGTVLVQDWTGADVRAEYIEGLQFEGGFLSRDFITETDRSWAVQRGPRLLLTDHKLASAAQVLPALEAVAGSSNPRLVVVASDVSGEAMGALIANHARGVVHCLAVRAPAFQQRRADELRDVAILTGGRAFIEEAQEDPRHARPEDLGMAEKVLATAEHTTLVGGGGDTDAILGRIEELEGAIEVAEYEFDRERLRERIAKLTGGVAIVRAGAEQVNLQKERRRQVDNALRAARAVLREGAVAGGGGALAVCASVMEAARPTDDPDMAAGYLALARGLEAPLRCLAASGAAPDRMLAQVQAAQRNGRGGSWGYDALADEPADVWERGIVDPLPVVRDALRAAVSVAALVVSVGAVHIQLDAKPQGSYEKWA